MAKSYTDIMMQNASTEFNAHKVLRLFTVFSGNLVV